MFNKSFAVFAAAMFPATLAFAQVTAPAKPAGSGSDKSTSSASGVVTARGAAPSCEAQAVSKDGKPLTGAAKTASIRKCESDTAACAAKAVDKNGKPLAGAAKTSFMKKCEAGK